MRWKRLGRTFDPTAETRWMRTHGALPTIIDIDGGLVRVACAGRDAEGRGEIAMVRFSASDNVVVDCSSEPMLRHGELGSFDDRGVLPSCIIRTENRWLMYYTGVMLGHTVPFYFAVGVAASEDAIHWQRLSRAPMLERNAVDPLMTASPYVLFDEGRFRMWYVSCVRWEMRDGEPRHYYHIRYAESENGLDWSRDGRVCIDFLPGEYAIARPCVMRDGGIYRMWFPYRGDRYKIGYAESVDGLTWLRNDGAMHLTGEAGSWENEMQCYPCVFDANDGRYMVYNGNDYGRTGFGLAKVVE